MFKCKHCGNSEFTQTIFIMRDVIVDGNLKITQTLGDTDTENETPYDRRDCYICTACNRSFTEGELARITTHDFNDGKGAVPAHRHNNPDGTTGGWIAETAYVAPTAYVGKDACVYGLAGVYDSAVIMNRACVFGQAKIFQKARIAGSAKIYGYTEVSGTACIGGEAYISGDVRINGNTVLLGETEIH